MPTQCPLTAMKDDPPRTMRYTSSHCCSKPPFWKHLHNHDGILMLGELHEAHLQQHRGF